MRSRDVGVLRALHATFVRLPDDKFNELEAEAKLPEPAPEQTREVRSLWLLASGIADHAVMARLSIAFNHMGLLIVSP